jgi:hypothetical protein
MSLRNPFDDAKFDMNARTIYHNHALLGFAEVVDGDDLALPSS